MFLKSSAFAIALAAIAGTLSPPLLSPASAAQQRVASTQCRYYGAVWHRCYNFRSDATWPNGIPHNRNSNGG
jgi:hypothetical protein